MERSFTLDKGQALRGEKVTATLPNLKAKRVEVTVANQKAPVVSNQGEAIVFTIPEEAPTGPQKVVVTADNRVASGEIEVLGQDTDTRQVTIIVQSELAENRLERLVASLGFKLLDVNTNREDGRLFSLGSKEGPCSGQIALIDVGGKPLGEAIEDLEKLAKDNPDLILYIDPRSAGSAGTIDHLGAVGARAAHERGAGGKGVFIAVFDTGLSPHSELAGRVSQGYNALNDTTNVTDTFANGHGTPVAILAAGETLGVAPESQVVPVQVCDGANGSCQSHHVIIGTCHVLSRAEEGSEFSYENLVLNYSLGGDTEIDAITAILDYALGKNVLIAAAGGNKGSAADNKTKTPPALLNAPEYPAASRALEGLVAVAALQTGEPCIDFEDLAVRSRYTVGQTFVSGGTLVSMGPFFFVEGQSTSQGAAQIDQNTQAGGSGKDVSVNNINLTFGFDSPLEGVTINYGDYGGTVNLEINGDLAIASSLFDLNKTTVGDVRVSVTPDPATNNQTGIATLSGTIKRFSLGGQEFWLDDVCPVQGTGVDWKRASFSTVGDYIDIAAPGAGVTSGAADGSISAGTHDGTSYAAPMVAGALALWREANPGMSPVDIEAALKKAAQPLFDTAGNPQPEKEVGAGLLNLNTSP